MAIDLHVKSLNAVTQLHQNISKAELVEGIVYITYSVSHVYHGRPHAHLCALLSIYCIDTPGTESGNNSTVRLDWDNEPQPDALLRLTTEVGGSSIIDEDGFIQGPPELVAEIANSTASYDMHDKFNAYRRNGVREYLAWLVRDQEIRWYVLEEGEYQLLKPDEQGIVKSHALPGLWLNTKAMLDEDLGAALETVQTGLKSSEHQKFISILKQKLNEGSQNGL